mmetsp:Transcript_121305/g.387641  ORF Transcript_121305/g.387641 Transcript_121305/m.387641 type:complete len:169 (-) Transcript_121305:89-595(-)
MLKHGLSMGQAIPLPSARTAWPHPAAVHAKASLTPVRDGSPVALAVGLHADLLFWYFRLQMAPRPLVSAPMAAQRWRVVALKKGLATRSPALERGGLARVTILKLNSRPLVMTPRCLVHRLAEEVLELRPRVAKRRVPIGAVGKPTTKFARALLAAVAGMAGRRVASL